MKKIANLKYIFLLLIIDFIFLSYGISTLSISKYEASIYYGDFSLLKILAHFGTLLFGQNDFGLRFTSLFFHFLSCILLYILALKYTKTKTDALFSLLLFILLPGTIASALLVNEASFVLFLSLVILCAYEYGKKYLFYVCLILSLFVDSSFNILFLTFFFFALYKKNSFLTLVSIVLFAFNLAFYGFETGGKPSGHFLDTLGIFAACFSPLVFIYFFYVIYRLAFKKDKNLLWFLMSVTFIFCLVLSLRQRLFLEDFLPFCVICTPLLIKTLMASYRVRLPKFRLKYKIFIECAVIFLTICYLAIVANKALYAFISNPQRHFAYNYHLAKELSIELKKQGVNAVRVAPTLQERLKFYGIDDSVNFYLRRINDKTLLQNDKKTIKISLGKHEILYQVLSYEKKL
ncbi:hypothetical protein FMM56_03565 [Campylobacter sp. LR264d]|uniref:glycosyltransferase family 39 protein n=1 Tax=unclassified Campylobacter TaxID=2593542 RepID=UPI001239B76B|nr:MULTISPECIES: glycosyltransferase family 39 protein [unclassified Campylobacter]KAA6225047.1 hypothetical protein FMM55_07040 [Campylobacter sp. LR196d]KAA6233426.1 hypothetical protein FMM56_03565 [Campylobacter sp. LR264d]